MGLKTVLLALALGAVTAAGAAAEGGPGPGGGHPGLPPPKSSPGETEDTDHQEAAGERAFRAQLTALGYTCLRRPVMVRGSLTAVGTDSLTLHSLRPGEHGRQAAAADIVAKVISTTLIRRAGHSGPATLADLVVKDMVEVHAAACHTAAAAAGTPPTLVARQLNARAPHA